MQGEIVTINLILNTLTIVAGLALFIERSIEILKHSVQFAGKTSEREGEISLNQSQLAQAREKLSELENILDEMDNNQGVVSKSAIAQPLDNITPVLDESDAQMMGKHEQYDAFKLIPARAKSHEKIQMVVFYQFAALGLGVIAADLFNIRLLSLFLSPLGTEAINNIPAILDIVLSGVVIGGGSQPVHALIRFITERKLETKNKSIDEQPLTLFAKLNHAARSVNQQPWESIDYQGGVNPLSLEHRNFRKGNPLKIIYHHSAMPDHTRFQEVVDEFLVTKGWSTGYHSVIMPNGAIHPFCRWDRVGNHAKKNNNRTLGVAFHGNFHTLKNDKFSNADGSFGAKEPSPEQLDAGARQIALWAKLYDLDIELDVLPHKDVLPGHTVCPGSNFPHGLLKQKITYYYNMLEKNESAKSDLANFKQKPYVYV